ncbi:MAG: class I SAM-dependent methyltransferase [Colwellia sp.]|nr:class I SAM-dependent methyltransferase [Colwellia sp.]
MNKGLSNSVGRLQGLIPWLRENACFLLMRIKGFKNKEGELELLVNEIDSYSKYYKTFTGSELIDASILEIGYGARPNRLLAFVSLQYDARGIDLDTPLLNGSLSELVGVYRKNGLKRLSKSFIRNILFDRHERSSLNSVLQRRGKKLIVDESRFLVGDASSFDFLPESVDFIYSEDVFEHIPKTDLHKLCHNLSKALSSNGLALISPSVYTGISGGHLAEWYPYTLQSASNRKSEPWEHLRKKRYIADCFLNKMRVEDFKELFYQYFEVIDVISNDKGIGSHFLTNVIRRELSDYTEDELLSNKWTYVLRKLID